ncbi:MAG: hypothetical protein PHS92_03350 [Candidatus Gracilibacteria bacterium]|nr:hypothetical protein [Candidatus Gracilibacteria bacterium]
MEIRKSQLKNEAENIYRNIYNSENPQKDLKRLQEIEKHLVNLNWLMENIKKETEKLENDNDTAKIDINQSTLNQTEREVEEFPKNNTEKKVEPPSPLPIVADMQVLRTEKIMTEPVDSKAEVKNTPLSFVENNNREIMITTILFIFLLFIGRIIFYKILSSLIGSSPGILYRFSKNFRNRLKQRRNTKKAYVRVDSGIENLRDSINNAANNEPYRFGNSISPESLRFEPVAEIQQTVNNTVNRSIQQNSGIGRNNRHTARNNRPVQSRSSNIPEGRINHQTSTDERGGRIDNTYIGSNIDGRVPVDLL